MSQTKKLGWIVSIAPEIMIEAHLPAPAFQLFYWEVEDAVNNLLARNLTIDYTRKRHPFPLFGGADGSAGRGQLVALADDMVEMAYDLYKEICAFKDRLESVHVVAAQNGAAFALKFLVFFDHWKYDLQSSSVDKFVGEWNIFSLPNHICGRQFEKSPLFRSLTIVQPSLPTPSFWGRILAMPDVYFLAQESRTPFIDVSCLIKVDGLSMTGQDIEIEGPHTGKILIPSDEYEDLEKVRVTIKKELQSFWSKNPPKA